MFIGIDLGTSAVKFVLVDEEEQILASAEEALRPYQPRPGWSEDHPDAWWAAVERGLDRLAAGRDLAAVRGIGLSGQMHGALLVDAAGRPVRPAILWNDSRAQAEADELAALPGLSRELGIVAMPSFTGPKMLWLARHEPDSLARARRLMLPKDYIRLRLTGEVATDVSDASGAWLIDQERRSWSAAALRACGIDPALLPELHESTAPTGTVRPAVGARWGLGPRVVVAGGAGDAAAGAVGIGCVDEGRGVLSLGTSSQIFVADRTFRPDPDRLVHDFCHAVPRRWFRMAALLNGASPLAALSRWVGVEDVGTLIALAEAAYRGPSRLMALPYLFGERTPLNDAQARVVLFGLDVATERADIAQAMLEGVAFSLADGLDALRAAGVSLDRLSFIGGGSRSLFWSRLIASVLGLPLVHHRGSAHGPAFGAARLGRLATTGEAPGEFCRPPPVDRVTEPDAALHAAYADRMPLFRSLYRALKPEFARHAAALPSG